ncbi:MAG: BTB/POZ domain-containing protein [Streptococcus gallolyticus]|nr:BTB/POZ domain-containing protein [Streptococcus gallolyticus]
MMTFLFLCLWVFFFISDLQIKVGDRHISAHKFVLAARSDSWSLANLSSTEELDLSGESLSHQGQKMIIRTLDRKS